MFLQLLAILFVAGQIRATAREPFLIALDSQTHVIGNDLWNVTIGRAFGTKLFYNGIDLVGNASGHYVSYNGAANNLSWTRATPAIFNKTDEYTDIVFSSDEGEIHWVLTPTLAGAYQYFINRALPTLGEFRTLWRLDNSTFTHGYTSERNEALVPLKDIRASGATKVQDETWQRTDGSFITKYDFSTFLPNKEGDLSFWGLYGPLAGNPNGEKVGSWYIHGGKDYLNGDHLKQELIVHRESITGDAVQLNMIHGTHFQVASSDSFLPGKMWGPWLWYLNDGSPTDAAARAKQETQAWPYPWLASNPRYHSRGNLTGRIVLSDGRPASNAAIFLGDNHPTHTTLDQGAKYNYRTYANASGHFSISNVREGTWNLQAWPNGGATGDVTTVFSKNDISTNKGTTTHLDTLTWKTQGRKKIWQIGEMDRKATGFAFSGAPHKHDRASNCPSSLNFTIGKSKTKDWCFAQGSIGTWDVLFNFNQTSSPAAVLTVSLAAYSAGLTHAAHINNISLGPFVPANTPGDPAMYRSGTLAGEWRLFEIPVRAGALKEGMNKLEIAVTAKNRRWTGIMWDSLIMELA